MHWPRSHSHMEIEFRFSDFKAVLFSAAHSCLAPSRNAVVLISEPLLSYAVMTNTTTILWLATTKFSFFARTPWVAGVDWAPLSVVLMPEGEALISDMAAVVAGGRVMADRAIAPKASAWAQTAPLLLTSWPKHVIQPMGQEMSTCPCEGTKEGPCRMSLIEKSCKYFEQLLSIFYEDV